jgi:hypothetical protein
MKTLDGRPLDVEIQYGKFAVSINSEAAEVCLHLPQYPYLHRLFKSDDLDLLCAAFTEACGLVDAGFDLQSDVLHWTGRSFAVCPLSAVRR